MSDPTASRTICAMIRVEKLDVRRGRRQVLHDIDLSISDSDTVILVGPNGAGKTTLLQAIMGLLPHTSGRVLIRDKSVKRWSRRALAREIAFVPQEHDGFLGFVVRDVISAARYAYVSALGRATSDDVQAVERAIDECDIREFADRTLDTLSSGERQKVWIAAAVAQGSPALLLDEPTTALDPRHEAELVQLLRKLTDAGRTMLIVSHDLNLIPWMRGRVVALNDGRKTFDGLAADFLNPDRLRQVFNTEFQLSTSPDQDLPGVQLRIT